MPKSERITVECASRECGQSFIFREGVDYCETWNGNTKYFHRDCWERGYDRLRRDLMDEPEVKERYYE